MPSSRPITADLEARVSVLESRVQQLVDTEAIRDLRFRYHEYINEAKFTEIASLFTDDGDLLFGHLGNAHGRDEINRFFGGLLVKPDADGKNKQPRLSRVRQFIHNHVTLHDRTDYEDWPEPERKRHLLRLWLCPPNGRPLPPAFTDRYGGTEIGNRGGIMVPGVQLVTPMEAC